MRDYYVKQRDQWIPWEISYSMRLIPREKNTSRRNAILAIILPDRNGSYAYYSKDMLFPILRDNIENGYIELCQWTSFIYNPNSYIERTVIRKNYVSERDLTINLVDDDFGTSAYRSFSKYL